MSSTSVYVVLALLLPFTSSFNEPSFLQPAATSHDVISRRNIIQITAAGVLATGTLGLDSPAFASPTAFPAISISPAGKATLPKMGMGAWAWGDSFFWGYNKDEDQELEQVFRYAIDHGVSFFDTAELYGIGRSETLIKDFAGRMDSESQSQLSVATKFAALPWRTKRGDVVNAAEASVKRLGRPIDLYQIHFPNAFANEAYWDGLADCFDKGLVKSVGVSNYGKDAVRACHAALAKRGIPLSSNQVQMSLLYRGPLDNGLKDTCDELGVQTIAYSPLALGLLTGKYDPTHYPKGPRKKLAERLFVENGPAAERLFESMRSIARKRGGEVPLSQVALNWCIAKNTCVIPGARSMKQVKQNLGALEWKLSSDEVALLDEASLALPPLVPPEASPFPKKDTGTGMIMFDS